jgi:MFS family permease
MGETTRDGVEGTDGAGEGPIRRALVALLGRALRHRNFRLFTVGQTVSVIGTWMQQVAVSWLVYRLTDSALLLGVVAFVGQAPAFLLSPIAGVLADRWDKHRIVLVTQALAMVQALLLAALILTGTVVVWQIIVLMAILGAINGFDVPARQAFLIDMVGNRDDLPNAIALNSSMFNGARLVGPAIAGFVISLVGEGVCVLLNGLSYLAVLFALRAMDVPRSPPPAAAVPVISHMTEGFRYAFGFPPIRSILVMVGIVSLVGVPFTVLLPVFATDVLRGDARTLGILMGASGLGALAGALYLASRSTVRGLGRVIVVAAALFGLALIAFSFSRSLLLSVVLLAAAGFGMMSQMASSNTVLQTLVDDDKRGRVMSIYSMAFVGVTPLGSLLAGALASRLGAPATLAMGGAVCVAAAALFAHQLPALREIVRPIYTRLGIIPEVASGLQAVTHQTTPRTRP